MVSPKHLLCTIESALLGPSPPTPTQRIELMHAIRNSLSSLQSLLSYPPPKPSGRAQVQSREVRLPDSLPFSLDDQDVKIALKLSDDLHLNEIDSVCLLISANQEWSLMGREPLEIFRLAAGLWYTERRDLITVLHILFRAVVLDQGLEADIVSDIHKYLEDLISAGLRRCLISLLKDLNREEPAGLGGPHCEQYVLDSRGALVERQSVVFRERLILGHCLVLSVLVVWPSPKDVKDIFSTLKDSAAELSESNTTLKHQASMSMASVKLMECQQDTPFLEKDGALKLLAIELSLPHPEGDQFGAISKVYTPAKEGVEGSIWQLAKAYVVVNNSGYHQLISHWLNAHAVIEPFVIASSNKQAA